MLENTCLIDLIWLYDNEFITFMKNDETLLILCMDNLEKIQWIYNKLSERNMVSNSYIKLNGE